MQAEAQTDWQTKSSLTQTGHSFCPQGRGPGERKRNTGADFQQIKWRGIKSDSGAFGEDLMLCDSPCLNQFVLYWKAGLYFKSLPSLLCHQEITHKHPTFSRNLYFVQQTFSVSLRCPMKMKICDLDERKKDENIKATSFEWAALIRFPHVMLWVTVQRNTVKLSDLSGASACRTFPTGRGATLSDNCENTHSSCALLAAPEVSTAGFDHCVDGSAASDGASRAADTRSRGIHYPV